MHVERYLALRLVLAGLMWCGVSAPLSAQAPDIGPAPAGHVLYPGHLGRQSGDLEQIIHFYHDLLGTGLRGERHSARPFWSSPGLIEFANVPAHVEFRAVILPLPGTAAEPGGSEMTIEAIEYRNVERHQYVRGVQDPGNSYLGLIVRDLDATLARLKDAGVHIVTIGGEPLALPARPGFSGRTRAIMVRDPDGYPVELLERTPPAPSTAPAASPILGAYVGLAVDDIETTQQFYRQLIGPELATWSATTYTGSEVYNALRNTPGAEFRVGTALIPGSSVMLEFLQYRNIEAHPMRPVFQDLGIGHLLFMVRDMDVTMARLRTAGVRTLALSNAPVYIAPTVSALFVTDPNGFFVEFMHREQAPGG